MSAQVLKYELLAESETSLTGGRAFRIRALRDVPEHDVRVGDLGGFVEGEHNLSQDGSAWIAGEAKVTGRARVEADALVRDHAAVSDDAVIGGTSIVGGFSLIRDRVVIRDRALVVGAATLSDDILVGGDAAIRHSVSLWGDGRYLRRADVPWSLRDAKPTEPDYLDRLQEAARIDPAFHRVLGALGALDQPGRDAVVAELFEGSAEERKAIHDIARAIGGVFYSDRYEPRSTADLVADRGVQIEVHTSPSRLRGFRYLRMLNGDQGAGRMLADHPGTLAHAGVVWVETHDAAGSRHTLFQPALLLEDVQEPPALTPAPGRTMIAADVFETHNDAWVRADELLRAASEPGAHTPLARGRTVRSLDLAHLPLVVHARPVPNGSWFGLAHLTVQRVEPGSSALAERLGRLDEPRDFAIVEVNNEPRGALDLSHVVASLAFHDTVEAALRHVEPIYSDMNDLVERVPLAAAARERRLTELRQRSARPGPLDWARDRERHRLEARNAPVLCQVIPPKSHVPTPKPGAESGLSYDAIKASLPPLSWQPVHTASAAYQADSLNARFVIESQGADQWSLRVEAIASSGVSPMRLAEHPGLLGAEMARESAEIYRATLIAQELGLRTPEPVLAQQPLELTSVSRAGQVGSPPDLTDVTAPADHELPAWPAAFQVWDGTRIAFQAGEASLEHGRLRVRTDPPTYRTLAEAAEAAVQQMAERPQAQLDTPGVPLQSAAHPQPSVASIWPASMGMAGG